MVARAFGWREQLENDTHATTAEIAPPLKRSTSPTSVASCGPHSISSQTRRRRLVLGRGDRPHHGRQDGLTYKLAFMGVRLPQDICRHSADTKLRPSAGTPFRPISH